MSARIVSQVDLVGTATSAAVSAFRYCGQTPKSLISIVISNFSGLRQGLVFVGFAMANLLTARSRCRLEHFPLKSNRQKKAPVKGLFGVTCARSTYSASCQAEGLATSWRKSTMSVPAVSGVRMTTESEPS